MRSKTNEQNCPWCDNKMTLNEIHDHYPDVGWSLPKYNLRCCSCGASGPTVEHNEIHKDIQEKRKEYYYRPVLSREEEEDSYAGGMY